MTLLNKHQNFATAKLCGYKTLLVSCLLTLLVAACGGGGGGSGGRATSTSSAPAVTVTLSSSATSVTAGDRVTLNWSSVNANSCNASGGWSGARGTSGSETVGPIQSNQTFSLTCSGANGGTTQQVAVRLSTSEVDLVLQAARQLIRINDQVTLTWNATGADTCTASGAWSGAQPTSGSFTSTSLTSASTFTLQCNAGGQSAISSTTVDVTDLRLAWRAPEANVDGTPLTDLAAYNVHWGSSSRGYTNELRLDAGITEWDYSGLAIGTHFAALTAENEDGEESSYSTEVSLIVPE